MHLAGNCRGKSNNGPMPQTLQLMETTDHVVAVDDLSQSVILPTDIKKTASNDPAPAKDSMFLHERNDLLSGFALKRQQVGNVASSCSHTYLPYHPSLLPQPSWHEMGRFAMPELPALAILCS